MSRILTIMLLMASISSFAQVNPKQIAPGKDGENLFIRSGIAQWDSIKMADIKDGNTFIHNSTIQSVSIAGDSLKTATFTRGDNSFISATFVDKDNQTLSWNNGTRTLGIQNANNVVIPGDYGELQQTITGQTSPVFTLSQPINTNKHLTIVMNTGTIDPIDYSITGANQITLHFTPSASDRFQFYYKEN